MEIVSRTLTLANRDCDFADVKDELAIAATRTWKCKTSSRNDTKGKIALVTWEKGCDAVQKVSTVIFKEQEFEL
jgi:hypothetical protein